MNRKFKQRWVTIPSISTKQTTSCPHPQSLNIKKTMAYDVVNPGAGVGQAQKCGRVTPVNGIPRLLKKKRNIQKLF
jgi:hypothetical protein